MATLLTQKLDEYYENYKTKEIAFNKSIMNITGLEAKKIFAKIRGDDIHCILYSCSMVSAKIIVNLNQRDFENIKLAKSMISIRFSFTNREKKDSIVFFVTGMIMTYKNFETKNNNLYLVHINFLKKPPEDLIEILGRTLEIADNMEKRKDVRIELNSDTIKEIGLHSNNASLMVDGMVKNCIVKDISFSGALVIMQFDNPDSLKYKLGILHLRTYDNQLIKIGAALLRIDFVANRNDIISIGMKFDTDNISSVFKEMLTNYFSKTTKKQSQEVQYE